MARYIDLVGQQFGYWTVVGLSHKNDKNVVFWWCRCKCGTERAVRASALKGYGGSVSKSCGCYKKELLKEGRNTKHGLSKHPVYRVWKSMRQRCYDPNQDRYKAYGGRGITVCDRWDDFQCFYDDMIEAWFKGASIDRIDVNGNYEPNNCRWINKFDQVYNKRRTIWVEYKGHNRRLKELCKEGLVPNAYETIKARLKRGWEEQRALWEPSQCEVEE